MILKIAAGRLDVCPLQAFLQASSAKEAQWPRKKFWNSKAW
jgi:hypothetical protein